MGFKPEHIETFKEIFSDNWEKIKGFEGCRHVELLQDVNDPSVFFTYSLWENEVQLEAYRHSSLFAQVWGKTKILFNDRPQAWTLNEINS